MKKKSDPFETMTSRQISDWATMFSLCDGNKLVERIDQNGKRLDVVFSDANNLEKFELSLSCPNEAHAIQWTHKLSAFQIQ